MEFWNSVCQQSKNNERRCFISILTPKLSKYKLVNFGVFFPSRASLFKMSLPQNAYFLPILDTLGDERFKLMSAPSGTLSGRAEEKRPLMP